MTPPTHSTPTKRQEAGFSGPSLGATVGYLIALLAILLAFSYPVITGAVLLTLATVAIAWAIWMTATQ